MSASLLLEQTLNGAQLGVMLFLMSAGLTLVVGIMNVVNLTHGSIYMVGAYLGAAAAAASGSFLLGLLGAVTGTAIVGVLIEISIFRRLYSRSHLDQVLATFGLTLVFNEAVIMIWGRGSRFLSIPDALSGAVPVGEMFSYPVYRLVITACGLALGAGLGLVIGRTRLGMLIRAGASHATTVAALGGNVPMLYTLVFTAGAVMAGLAGFFIGPIVSINSSMGDSVLTLGLVVVVIGGLGSVRGAFIASLLLGVGDTCARGLLPLVLGYPLGPALASMTVYVFMAAILLIKPRGLLPIA